MKRKINAYWIGISIEILAIIVALICIFLNRAVPNFITILMLIGLSLSLILSFYERRKQNSKENINSNKIIIFFIILVVLILIMTFLTIF